MYTPIQLNELLVPELLDIAIQLDLPRPTKINREEIIASILKKQAEMATQKAGPEGERPKRKRITKSEKEAGIPPVNKTDMPEEPLPKSKKGPGRKPKS